MEKNRLFERYRYDEFRGFLATTVLKQFGDLVRNVRDDSFHSAESSARSHACCVSQQPAPPTMGAQE